MDETAGEKSSDNYAGASHQYSGTVGGTAMCQAAVTLTWAAPAGHALLGRALCLKAGPPTRSAANRRLSVKTASTLVKPAMWQRMRTGSATKGAKGYDWAMTGILPDDTPDGQWTAAMRSCCSVGTATPAPPSPNPAATGPTVMAGRYGAAATSTAPGELPEQDQARRATRRPCRRR